MSDKQPTNPRQKALDELARITQEELGGYEVTDNPLDRSQTTLKQPFTDKLMDDVLRGMSDLELELICQRDDLGARPSLLVAQTPIRSGQ